MRVGGMRLHTWFLIRPRFLSACVHTVEEVADGSNRTHRAPGPLP